MKLLSYFYILFVLLTLQNSVCISYLFHISVWVNCIQVLITIMWLSYLPAQDGMSSLLPPSLPGRLHLVQVSTQRYLSWPCCLNQPPSIPNTAFSSSFFLRDLLLFDVLLVICLLIICLPIGYKSHWANPCLSSLVQYPQQLHHTLNRFNKYLLNDFEDFSFIICCL